MIFQREGCCDFQDLAGRPKYVRIELGHLDRVSPSMRRPIDVKARFWVCCSCHDFPSFRLLLVINSTFCACATITWCPHSVSSRLIQGECVPVSMAMRLRGIFPKVCLIASGVLATFCSRMILPASSKTQ